MSEYKKNFLAYPDRGIFGTIVKIDSIGSEDGYSDVYYYPLQNGFTRGKLSVIKNVPNDCIHNPHNPFTDMGVQKDITYIYTDEQGSIVKGIFNNSLQKKVNELKEQVISWKKQATASRQEATDARSGFNKGLESVRAVVKSQRPNMEGLMPPVPPYGYRGSNYNDDFEEMGDY